MSSSRRLVVAFCFGCAFPRGPGVSLSSPCVVVLVYCLPFLLLLSLPFRNLGHCCSHGGLALIVTPLAFSTFCNDGWLKKRGTTYDDEDADEFENNTTLMTKMTTTSEEDENVVVHLRLGVRFVPLDFVTFVTVLVVRLGVWSWLLAFLFLNEQKEEEKIEEK
jgi:hypothetical protein